MSATRKVPTLEPWALEVLAELDAQADRIRAGVACRPCHGSGRTVHGGSAGVYWRECGVCRGSGSKVTNTTLADS